MTNRGKPVADVVPSGAGDSLMAQATIDNILAAKKYLISDIELTVFRGTGRK
jgi:antitoxin (DNA-binding transcriptional repressor) of toxin-antitoxin stability system